MPIRTLLWTILFLSASFSAFSLGEGQTLFLGFGKGNDPSGLPDGWKERTFRKIPRHTIYSLEKEGDRLVLKAVSEQSASMLYRELEEDPKKYPLLRWDWKIENLLKKSDPTRKTGDDYPARVYVAFNDFTGLNYIWESKVIRGKILPNPYMKEVKMIVVESGRRKLGEWVQEKRNIQEDYKKVFGRDPPALRGIAVMTDTDDTGEAATSYYAEIVLSSK